MLCWPNHRCITSNFELFWHFCGEKIIFLIEPFPRFIINHSFALFITLPWIKFSKDPCHVVWHPTGSPQYRVAMKILRRLWKKLYLSTTLGLDPGQPKTNWLNNAMKIGVLFTPCSNWIQFQAALPQNLQRIFVATLPLDSSWCLDLKIQRMLCYNWWIRQNWLPQ